MIGKVGPGSVGVRHVAGIVRAMKELSHPGSDEKSPFDLNRAGEMTVTVARNEWKYVADLAPDLPQVLGYPGDINQALLNLIVNASHAIQSGARPGASRRRARSRSRRGSPAHSSRSRSATTVAASRRRSVTASSTRS
jgi:two-component system NtrC family sensor kinase